MDYRRAYSILKQGMIYDRNLMKPFYTVWLRYGTTLPETLRQKSIDPYLIVSSCSEFRNSRTLNLLI